MVDISKVHKQNVTAYKDEKAWLLFHVGTKKQQEGQSKVKKDKTETQHVPISSIAENEVAGLLRNIGIPVEEKLRKGNVSPEDGEGEHELAHDMVVFRGNDLFEVAHSLEDHRSQDQNCHGAQRRTRKDVDSKHRGKP